MEDCRSPGSLEVSPLLPLPILIGRKRPCLILLADEKLPGIALLSTFSNALWRPNGHEDTRWICSPPQNMLVVLSGLQVTTPQLSQFTRFPLEIDCVNR